jgi:hypothetical protein
MASYSFKDTFCSLEGPGGSLSLGTAGVGTEGITISANTDRNIMEVGCGGAVQNSLVLNYSGTISLSLLKTSPGQYILNEMFNFQSASAVQWGKNIITLQTSNGDSVVCSQVSFKKMPSQEYKTAAGMVTWEFDAGSVVFGKIGSPII